MTREWVLAEFDSMHAVRDAIDRIRDMADQPIEVNSPYPVPGLDEALGLKRSRVPAVACAAGIAGGVIGLGIQWFTNAWDYPINVGGRPLLAWPAWVPVTFELTVLGAAFGAFVGLLIAMGLPRLWHPMFEVDGFDRVTTDRFWLAAWVRHVDLNGVRNELAAAGALRIAIADRI